jgi:hypothetical protein
MIIVKSRVGRKAKRRKRQQKIKKHIICTEITASVVHVIPLHGIPVYVSGGNIPEHFSNVNGLFVNRTMFRCEILRCTEEKRNRKKEERFLRSRTTKSLYFS